MRQARRMLLLVVLAGAVATCDAHADPGRARAWYAQAPSDEPAPPPPVGSGDARELRALNECEKEADLKGYKEGARRNRYLAACMRRKGFEVKALPGDSREREEEDRGWLERYRPQSP